MEKIKMKWDQNTIDNASRTEKICDYNFSILTGSTGWFSVVVKNPDASTTDYKSIDSRFRTVTIELKTRDITIDQYDSIMIECKKFDVLTGATSEKSWFINFLENSPDKFWICDIKSIMYQPISRKDNMKIKNKNLGDKYTYTGDRLFIPKLYGNYYEMDKQLNKYKLIW